MSDEDRYRYHAYNYGWQRVMLGRMEPVEPLDPNGDWFIASMAERAEEYHRQKMRMRPKSRYKSPPFQEDQGAVRDNWPRLLLKDLTAAERALLHERIDEIMRRLRSESPGAGAMVERLISNLSPMAQEIL